MLAVIVTTGSFSGSITRPDKFDEVSRVSPW